VTDPETLHLTVLEPRLAIVRMDSSAEVPAWAWRGNLVFISRTPDELSVVCDEDAVPDSERAVHDWRALMVRGPLDLGLTGIMARLTQPLAQAGIPVFALSTFDTDYLLVRAQDLDRAVVALRAALFVVGNGVGNTRAALVTRHDDRA
jgi:uncharacterized protein